jgi:hypothetical protein
LKARLDVQEKNLQLGMKPDTANWGEESEEDYGLLHTETDNKIVREKIKSLPGNYMDFFDQVCDAIVENRMPPVTADDGIRVMKIIEVAHESNRLKRVVDVSYHPND